MKICFIGNSQISAIKRGWEVNGFPGSTFLAAPSKIPQYLQVDGGRLSAPGEFGDLFDRFCGIREVVLSDFDAFVFVGMDFTPSRCLDLFLKTRPWNSGGESSGASYTPVSKSCYLSSAHGLLKRSSAVKVASRIRSVASTPIFIVPDPAVGETIKGENSDRGRLWSSVSTIGGVRFYDLFVQTSEMFSSGGLEVVLQMESTMVDGAFTCRQYVSGSHTLDGIPRKKNVFDHNHMNLDYGIASSKNIFDIINKSI